MNSWRKMGHIFCPDGNSFWMLTHAAVPFVEALDGDLIKIYFTSRDRNNKSFIGWIIVSIDRPGHILEISESPVLGLGETGFFDSDGVMGCDIININGNTYLFYIGWNLAVNMPFRNAIGLAIRPYGKEAFVKVSSGPILDRSIYDPCFVASNCVIEKDGMYYMYYLSCTQWIKKVDHYQHKYHIKIATSSDAVNWDRKGKVAIDFIDEEEYAISVPRVLQIHNRFLMWYSYRSENKPKTYRIGVAESIDAIHWKRLDESVGIDVSSHGWDSEMICYPYVFRNDANLYMLYNGNDYGKTGFGVAIMENSFL